MTIQKQLVELYESFKTKLRVPATLLDHLSPPLLLNAGDMWHQSHNRILVVGQETFGWGFQSGDYYDWPYPRIRNLADFLRVPNSVEAMVHGYRVFEFARHQPANHNSPFWRAYRQLRRAFDTSEEGIDTSVLWTNLWRIDMEGGAVMGTAAGDEGETVWKAVKGLLSAEIRILNPSAVIFFTGPDNDHFLQWEFEGATFEEFEPFKLREVAWMKQSILPAASVRSYHPGYLQYWNWQALTAIEKLVAKQLPLGA